MERGFPLAAPFAKAAHAGALTQYRLPLTHETAEFGSAPPLFWRHADFDSAIADGLSPLDRYLKVPAHKRPGCQICREYEWTEADAIANGSQIPCAELPKSCRQATLTERDAFRRIWDATEGKWEPWNCNPWVWVLTFGRVGGANG